MFPHEHPTHEFYFVMTGRGVMTVGDEDRAVGPGDLVYIPPDTVHSLRPTGGGADPLLLLRGRGEGRRRDRLHHALAERRQRAAAAAKMRPMFSSEKNSAGDVMPALSEAVHRVLVAGHRAEQCLHLGRRRLERHKLVRELVHRQHVLIARRLVLPAHRRS